MGTSGGEECSRHSTAYALGDAPRICSVGWCPASETRCTFQSVPLGSFVTILSSPLADALRDRYVLERELGRGGMATVYLARDLRHDRHVALKVVLPELGAVLGPDRFLGEIRVTAHLQHPNLLPLFDSGAADGHLWYTMPFIEGESLRA